MILGGRVRRFLLILPWILLVAVVSVWLLLSQKPKVAPTIAADGVEMPVEHQKPLIDLSKNTGVTSYSNAVDSAAPAVVNIFTQQKTSRRDSAQAQMLREFFGEDFPMTQPEQEQNSLGSGVIVRPDGYILTNNHVVAQAEQITVGLYDGRKAKATIVGTDPETDLAVIKIELNNLPTLPFKLSGNKVGDVVLAIGNPFGVGQTVTQGIISATERTGLGINTYEDFVQTDAAINPGNSGGALIDVAGNLVGVNTAIFSRTGGSLGIGFAIPASTCQQVLDAILTSGHVVRGWLGIEVKGIDEQDNFNLTTPQQGVKVMGVIPDGPAAQAGILQGDIITAMNGQTIRNANQLIAMVAKQTPNQKIPAQIIRKDEKITLNITISERPQRNDTLME